MRIKFRVDTFSVNGRFTVTLRGAEVISSDGLFAADPTSPNSVETHRSPCWNPSCGVSELVWQLFASTSRVGLAAGDADAEADAVPGGGLVGGQRCRWNSPDTEGEAGAEDEAGTEDEADGEDEADAEDEAGAEGDAGARSHPDRASVRVPASDTWVIVTMPPKTISVAAAARTRRLPVNLVCLGMG